MTTSAPTEYELVLMLDPEASDEVRDRIVSEARGRIEAGGTVKEDNTWGLRKMAYEIRRRTEADYRFFRFQGETQVLESLDHDLKIADGVLRFRIFKVDARSPVTIPPAPSPMGSTERPPRRGHDEAPPAAPAPPAAEEAPEPPAEAPAEAAEAPAQPAETGEAPAQPAEAAESAEVPAEPAEASAEAAGAAEPASGEPPAAPEAEQAESGDSAS